MLKFKRILPAFAFIFAAGVTANAQTESDALRMLSPNVAPTARVSAFGTSFYGLLDEGSAMIYNPAGLTNICSNELSVGISTESDKTTTNFFGNSRKTSAGDDNITHATFLSSFKIGNRNAAFSLGYFLDNNFNNFSKFRGVNNDTSYVAYQTYKPYDYLNDNLGFYLWLADTVPNLYTPIHKGLTQCVTSTETGGIHSFAGALAFDVTDNLSLGFNLIGKWGTYEMQRQYIESDDQNLYNALTPNFTNVDFDSLIANEHVKQDISGFTCGFGLMYHYKNAMKFSLGVKLPTWYSVDQNDYIEASSTFDNKETVSGYHFQSHKSFNFRTPFVYSLGLSGFYQGLTVTTGLEYSDASQMKFTDVTDNNINTSILEKYQSYVNWGIGGEYMLPIAPFSIRASYSESQSPYMNETDMYKIKNTAFGASFDINDNVRISATYKISKYDQYQVNFGDNLLKTSRELSSLQIQFSYRFKADY